MADENESTSVPYKPPPLLQLQEEITELETELHTRLRRLERRWSVEVMSVDYNSVDVTIRCEVKNSKVH